MSNFREKHVGMTNWFRNTLLSYTGEDFNNFFNKEVKVYLLKFKSRIVGIRLETVFDYYHKVNLDISIEALTHNRVKVEKIKSIDFIELKTVKHRLVSDYEIKNSILVDCIDEYSTILSKIRVAVGIELESMSEIEDYLKELCNFYGVNKLHRDELYKSVKTNIKTVPIEKRKINKPYVLTEGFGSIYGQDDSSLGYFTANNSVIILRSRNKERVMAEIKGCTFKIISEGNYNAPSRWVFGEGKVKGYIPNSCYSDLSVAEIKDVLQIAREISVRGGAYV